MPEADATASGAGNAEREWSSAVKDLGDKIVGLSVLEAKELGDYLEEVHGIEPVAAAVAMPQAVGAGAGPEEEEQTSFTVVLTGYGQKQKIQVIKAVRAMTTLGLKEAKDLVESAPVNVKEEVSKEEAEKVKTALEEAGGTAELK